MQEFNEQWPGLSIPETCPTLKASQLPQEVTTGPLDPRKSYDDPLSPFLIKSAHIRARRAETKRLNPTLRHKPQFKHGLKRFLKLQQHTLRRRHHLQVLICYQFLNRLGFWVHISLYTLNTQMRPEHIKVLHCLTAHSQLHSQRHRYAFTTFYTGIF